MICGNLVTIETEGSDLVKGGVRPTFTEELTVEEFMRRWPNTAKILLAAEVREDSWYLGRCDTLKTMYMRQGIFEAYSYFDGQRRCIELEVIEEYDVQYRTHGNGEGVAKCFVESAAAFYERIQWPNGRRCYTVVKHF
jgi:hypothetical protein